MKIIDNVFENNDEGELFSFNTSHGWGISACAYVQIALLYIKNGLTDCVQIWYVGWGSLSKCFPQVMGRVGHLYTCARAPRSPISVSQDQIGQFC